MNKECLNHLNRELAEAREDLRMWQDLRQSLARARRSLRLRRRTRSELEKTLNEQGVDVEMLESLSLRGLFLTFLGKRKE